jgi:ATP diphosphatase
LGEKAAHAGFDWRTIGGVLAKLHEELGELEAALDGGDRRAAAAELGDLLFAATSLARHLGTPAEDALQGASDRFSRRFRHMEAALGGRDMHSLSDDELDTLWCQAKRDLGAAGSE